MSLLSSVNVAQRFQRSIRIDTDLHDPKALEGFICPKTSADVLQTMAKHHLKTGQAAFTWTGPYGSGKSSLVIALSAILNGNESLRKDAQETIGGKVTATLWDAFPPKSKGWRILPVIGQRERPAQVIGDALIANGYVEKGKRRWGDDEVIESLLAVAQENPRSHGGVVLFLDEMGKFLEGAAHDGADIYLFQRLAETASRSNGRLLVVGILHQAFDEYAQRLARDVRDEWAKVQGRFVDLSINITGDEQLDLLARAIRSDHSKLKKPSAMATRIAHVIRAGRPSAGADLALMLEHCWPLHPIVAALLGPISRRRFGQNQRSLFGFLNSAEPFGFQDYLREGKLDGLFSPDNLWDYLRTNLEPSILASPDGHKWSTAVDAIERCGNREQSQLHVKLLKGLALIDLFRERSGLLATYDLLGTCLPDETESRVKSILKDLEKWSLVVYRKHIDAFAIYAGSDFDIEQALQEELGGIRDISFKELRSIAGLQPIMAKRHYHKTGALRWFDVDLVPLAEAAAYVAMPQADNGAMGRFLLAIPTQQETPTKANAQCQQVANLAAGNAMVGLSTMSWHVVQLGRELIALTKISADRPELAGDSVARREVMARLASVRSLLEHNLQRMFDTATWYSANEKPKPYTSADLNMLASQIADKRYKDGPLITNELLNRQKLSPNAVTAQKALLKLMVRDEGEERLGIQGYPAEGGLFDSIIAKAGVYVKNPETGWIFATPTTKNDPSNLLPMWAAGIDLLTNNSQRTVGMNELFELWSKPPFGLKNGLLPIVAVVFLLASRDKLAFYRQGIFQAKFTDFDIDLLTNDPSDVQLRWMNLSDHSKKLLSGMALVVREIDTCNILVNLEPIDVARGLVSIFQTLQPWTKRTLQLSSNAQRVRDLFKMAVDPNKFIFDDIPSLFADIVGSQRGEKEVNAIVTRVREGLQELTQAYGIMLEQLQQMMLGELHIPNTSSQALSDLRERAVNVRQLSGDFRLEAFVGRISQFKGALSDMEGIASLATNKPSKDWVDSDLAQARIEIADLCQKFIRLESFARVQGRTDKRQAMSVVVGMNGRPTPISGEFSISDTEQQIVNDLVHRVELAFGSREALGENIILAALAEISARYLVLNGDQGVFVGRMSNGHDA